MIMHIDTDIMHACVIIGSSAIDYESDWWTDLV